MKTTRVFSISGYSETGKTTLISKLSRKMRNQGYTISVVKSTSKDVMPPEKSDTGIFMRGGSEVTILLGPSTTTVSHKKRLDVRDILRGIDLDFILIEGGKQSKIPKFWCVGKCQDTSELADRVEAIVHWKDFEEQCMEVYGEKEVPILSSENLSALIEIIIDKSIPLSDAEL
jgi:molybdopterin-guanine dinucleotide biosynthesis protein B